MVLFMQGMKMDTIINKLIEMDLTNLLGHLGYICIVIGMIFLARKSAMGWLFRMAGDLLWTIIGVMLSMSSIWFWCSVFLVLDAYGYWHWKKKQKIT